MKEYIKLFDVPNSADGYEINDIPWVSAVESTEQLLYCDEENKKLEVSGTTVNVVDNVVSNIITYKSNVALQNFNSSVFDATVVSHEYDSNTKEGVITFDAGLTEIGRNGGYISSNNDYVTEITIPKTVTYWRDNSLFDNYRDPRTSNLTINVTQQDNTIVSYSQHRGGHQTIYFYLSNGVQVSIRISYECIAKNTPITLASGARKMIQDINYEDELLVWDFDDAKFSKANPLWIRQPGIATEYYLCKFSDGSELKLIGPSSHRVFNYTDQRFDYAIDCVGKEVYTENGLVTLESFELVNEQIEYYNIITKYHMNLFANDILTSCRYNNIYPIDDMKFVKEEREPVPQNINIPDEYYTGLRLAEQVIPISKTEEYVQNLINRKK